MKKKLLLFGASGLFGINFIEKYKKFYSITAVIHNKNIDVSQIKKVKYSTKNDLKKIILSDNYDYILNAAAVTDINICEKNWSLANGVNFELVKEIILELIANSLNHILFIQISTDHYTFSGNSMKEDTVVRPINNYGKSKRNAEKYILKNYKNFLIIRTNFFGIGPSYRNSITDFIYNKAFKNEFVYLSNKIKFTPIYLETLFNYLIFLIRNNINGLFHVGGKKKLTKYQFGLLFCKINNLDSSYIIKKISSDIVKKPINMALDSRNIEKVTNIKLPTLEMDILRMINNSKLIK